jgi:hypothetical protein
MREEHGKMLLVTIYTSRKDIGRDITGIVSDHKATVDTLLLDFPYSLILVWLGFFTGGVSPHSIPPWC